MRLLTAVFATVVMAAPAAAQSRSAAAKPDKIALRPFFVTTGQEFMARNTFKAAFGSRFQPFWWGGGVEVVFLDKIFVDVTASRFSKTGQRVFRFNGQTFQLNVPLRVTETPLEFTAGYRFRAFRRLHRLVPYAGGGVGTYQYTEKSDFADPTDNVDDRHEGLVAVGGGELPVYHDWIRVGVDAQYTYVPGILGYGGVSAAVVSGDRRERDLGGIAARVRVIVGR